MFKVVNNQIQALTVALVNIRWGINFEFHTAIGDPRTFPWHNEIAIKILTSITL